MGMHWGNMRYVLSVSFVGGRAALVLVFCF
jgi:hypothetical protein